MKLNINKLLSSFFNNPTSIIITLAALGVGYYLGQRFFTGGIPFTNPVPKKAEKPEDLPIEDGAYQEALNQMEPIEEFVDSEGNDAGFGIPNYQYHTAQTPANANNMMKWDNNEVVDVVDYFPPPSI